MSLRNKSCHFISTLAWVYILFENKNITIKYLVQICFNLCEYHKSYHHYTLRTNIDTVLLAVRARSAYVIDCRRRVLVRLKAERVARYRRSVCSGAMRLHSVCINCRPRSYFPPQSGVQLLVGPSTPKAEGKAESSPTQGGTKETFCSCFMMPESKTGIPDFFACCLWKLAFFKF